MRCPNCGSVIFINEADKNKAFKNRNVRSSCSCVLEYTIATHQTVSHPYKQLSIIINGKPFSPDGRFK